MTREEANKMSAKVLFLEVYKERFDEGYKQGWNAAIDAAIKAIPPEHVLSVITSLGKLKKL